MFEQEVNMSTTNHEQEDHDKTNENRGRIIGIEAREAAIMKELERIRAMQEHDHQSIAEIKNTITSNKGFWAGVLLAAGAFWSLVMGLIVLIKDKVFG